MNQACAHCGLPVVSFGRATSTDEPVYCCSGCHVAFHLSGKDGSDGPKRFLARVLLSAFVAMGVMVFSLSLYGESLGEVTESEASEALKGLFRLGALGLSSVVVVLLGMPLTQAVVSLGRWFSTDALVVAGALAAWGISCWNTFVGGGEVYFDTATMVLVLYGAGRYLDSCARERARAQLEVVLEKTSPEVERVLGIGDESVSADDLRPGDRVRLRPGETLTFDGVIEAGRSFVDTSALTGESEPRSLGVDDSVWAGSKLQDGTLMVRVEAVTGSRVRDEIARALGSALSERAELARIADRFAAVLLPVVMALAAWTGVSTYLASGLEAAILAALTVVLISCPCALGVATPLAFWVALGEAWKRGILVRGGEVLERLARAERFAFDKTGTLTSSEMELCEIESELAEDEVLALAAALERGSEHPIGKSICSAWKALELKGPIPKVTEFKALVGRGVEGVLAGARYSLTRAVVNKSALTRVDLRREDDHIATFGLRSTLVPGVRCMLGELRNLGFEAKVLTGDTRAAGDSLALELGVEVEAELLPSDKVERVRGVGTVFVGDGLNDSAAMAAADIGITVPGSVSTSIAMADINLLGSDQRELPWLVELSRRAVKIARLNLFWACAYNSVGLWLAVQGKLTPVVAAAAMVFSSVLVVLNSSRLARAVEHKSTSDNDEVRAPIVSGERALAQ